MMMVNKESFLSLSACYYFSIEIPSTKCRFPVSKYHYKALATQQDLF